VSASPASPSEKSEQFSLDSDPTNRAADRALARLGLLDDAMPLFADGDRVPRAGVLLAVAALVQSGVFDVAEKTYGSIGPAFYGLRTTLTTLLFMALLRIKRPEVLKEHSPPELGCLLGLDRAPEVKTLRQKLAKLAAVGHATDFGRRLAERRVSTHGAAMGFLYFDGHVRVYHGQHEIPKAHVTQRNLCMPATTDYWINDQNGDPLLVLTAEANAGLVKMLPSLCVQVRKLIGERRVTIVFDRGGWSPKLFRDLIAQGFDILTYRKGKTRRLPKKRFVERTATIDGNAVQYTLAEHGITLLGGKLRLRQITILSESGHQTHIVTSRRDLDAVELAYRMFDRWRQENFFKYLGEEYALDALVDYDVVPDDGTREVPNPKWAEISAKLQAARARIAELAHRVGVDATLHELGIATKQRILTPELRKELAEAISTARRLAERRKKIPKRIPVAERSNGPVVKLAVERKHLTNVLKMVAYQAESDLVRAITPHYKRATDECRTLVQAALVSAADIRVGENELRVTLAPQSSPHRSRALASLCEQLNAIDVQFPGTSLRLRYAVAEPA
jgi:prepilin-type processing-associated H-X9-DG protein